MGRRQGARMTAALNGKPSLGSFQQPPPPNSVTNPNGGMTTPPASSVERNNSMASLNNNNKSSPSHSNSRSKTSHHHHFQPTKPSWDLTSLPSVVSSFRQHSRSIFYRHGLRVSSHPIPTLLVSCFILSIVLYPTLFLYVWISTGGSGSLLVDPEELWKFVTKPLSQRAGLGGATEDLNMVWDVPGVREEVLSSDEVLCWENVEKQRVIRVEQVLVTTEDVVNNNDWSSIGIGGIGRGVLERRTLHAALKLQQEVHDLMIRKGIKGSSCLMDGNEKECLVLSPLDFWTFEQEQDGIVSSIASSSSSSENGFEEPSSLPSSTPSTSTFLSAHRGLMSPYLLDPLTATDEVNLTSQGLPLAIESTFSGRVMSKENKRRFFESTNDTKRSEKLRRADYVALTFFLEEELDGGGGRRAEHGWWLDGIKQVKGEFARLLPAQRWAARRFFVLKHRARAPLPITNRNAEEILYALVFVALLYHFIRRIRSTNTIYSKNGIFLAGTVQFICGGALTLSLCALLGLSLELVPWQFLGILVVTCGMDDLLIMIQSINYTSSTLPVRDRVALGLRAVGTSMFMVIFVELHFVVLIARLIQPRTIKEWISFIGIALICMFGLEMTFFLAVLSIDLRRLELGDFLRHQSVGHNKDHHSRRLPFEYEEEELGSWSSVRHAFCSSIKQRAVKCAMFGALIVINTILLLSYGPSHYLPAFCQSDASLEGRYFPPSLGPKINKLLAGIQARNPFEETSSPAEIFWQVINPEGASAVHVYVEPAAVIALDSHSAVNPPAPIDRLVIALRPFYTVLRLVLVPICLTMLTLWLSLLWLLRDREKLELEREHDDSPSELASPDPNTHKRSNSEGHGLDTSETAAPALVMSLLRAKHLSDVELLASSGDAILSWSAMDDSLTLWHLGSGPLWEASGRPHSLIPLPHSLLEEGGRHRSRGFSLNSLIMDEGTRFCAASLTGSSRIVVWDIRDQIWLDFDFDWEANDFGAVCATSVASPPDEQGTPNSSSTSSIDPIVRFFTLHTTGCVLMWDCSTRKASLALSPSIPKSDLSNIQPSALRFFSCDPRLKTGVWPILSILSSAGKVKLFRETSNSTTFTWAQFSSMHIGSSLDPVHSMAAGEIYVGPSLRTVVLAGTSSGTISLWDATKGKRISTIANYNDLGGPPSQLRLVSGARCRCPTCQLLTVECLLAIVGSPRRLLVYHLTLPSGCTCSSNVATSKSPRRSSRAPSPLPSPNGPQSADSLPIPRHASRRKSNSSLSDFPSPPIVLNDGPTLSQPNTPNGISKKTSFPFNQTNLIQSEEGTEMPSKQDWADLNVTRVLTRELDERGAWEILGTNVVGVGRNKLKERGVSGWEAWVLTNLIGDDEGTPVSSRISSIQAGTNAGGSNGGGVFTRSAPLHQLFRQSSQSFTSGGKTLHPAPSVSSIHSNDSNLRNRRRPSERDQQQQKGFAPTHVGLNSGVDLPFTRIGPFTSAFDGTALLLGMGNGVGVLESKEDEGDSYWHGSRSRYPR